MSRELVYGRDAEILAWAEQTAGHSARADAKAIGLWDEARKLRGAFVFDDFGTQGCEIHIVSDGSWGWIGRDADSVLTRVFAYPFTQCGFGRLTARIAETNAATLRLVRRRGIKQEGRLRRAAPDGSDYIVFGMLREECRWVPPALPFAAARLAV